MTVNISGSFANTLTQRQSAIQGFRKFGGSKTLNGGQERNADSLERDLVAVAFDRIRHLGQQPERLVEVADGVVVSGTHARLFGGTPQKCNRLGRIAAAAVVLGQVGEVIIKLIGKEFFDRDRGSFVHFAAPFAQHGIVGDFLGERVLESILAFRKGRLFINEFGKLQSGQLARQFIFGPPGDVANQAERKFLADDGEGLQQLLFASAQPDRFARPECLEQSAESEWTRGVWSV